MRVTIDLDPKLWWKLSGEAQRRQISLGELVAQRLTGQLRPVYRRITPHDVEHWTRLYVDQQRTLAQIADECGYNLGTIRRELVKAGVEMRRRGVTRKETTDA